MSTEMLTRPDEETFVFEDAEFEVICDILKLRETSPGVPACKGEPARWVAWRANCCAAGPKFWLLCNDCKKTYQNWAAWGAGFSCVFCDQFTGGFLAYTELGKTQ